ncbi:hypothetical protein HanRHA438_Chr13g0585171 [Helianthus annuus]|nr:hypothetical protein HanRHA438_Chr13g0585171 [Helianthus annuus]
MHDKCHKSCYFKLGLTQHHQSTTKVTRPQHYLKFPAISNHTFHIEQPHNHTTVRCHSSYDVFLLSLHH